MVQLSLPSPLGKNTHLNKKLSIIIQGAWTGARQPDSSPTAAMDWILAAMIIVCTLLGLLSGDQASQIKARKERNRIPRILDKEVDKIDIQNNTECQEGDPLGANYTGTMNVTRGGKSCKFWESVDCDYQYDYQDVVEGGHNFCRNPSGDEKGVWCYVDCDTVFEYCPVPVCNQSPKPLLIRVLDFSADNDNLRDEDGKHTKAELEISFLPRSFTICSSIMVEDWTTDVTQTSMFNLVPSGKFNPWGHLYLEVYTGFLAFSVSVDQVYLQKELPGPLVFFPLHWIRACVSINSIADKTLKVSLVVNGQKLGEDEADIEDEWPTSATLLLGHNRHEEHTGKITDLNIFNSSLSAEKMVDLTMAGSQSCGTPGDLLNWEEANWTLSSQAKIVEVDRVLAGSCREESQVQVFSGSFTQQECMRHCQKIASGRSPSVVTGREWENLSRALNLITPEPHDDLPPFIWISATEGDKDGNLKRLAHWPEEERINNTTVKLEASEGVWRDFYTGKRLENWRRPWWDPEWNDTAYGETDNCMFIQYFDEDGTWNWDEIFCTSYDTACVCTVSKHKYQPNCCVE